MKKEDEDLITRRERMRRETAGLPYDGPDEAAIRASARALWQKWQVQQTGEQAEDEETKPQTWTIPHK